MTQRRAVKLSDEQRRVLKRLARMPGTPKDCRCGAPTFVALSSRGLIYIATTFASVGYPRTSARAEITDSGRAALRAGRGREGVK